VTVLNNFVDQRFGRLVVLERTTNDRHNKVRWSCRCDCGALKVVGAAELQSGDTRSCGCLQRETSGDTTRRRLAGERVGMLSILRLVPNPKKRAGKLWECLCECGKTCLLSSKNLNGHHYRSCGCVARAPRIDNREAIIRRRYNAYRQNARRKERDFELTYTEFHALVVTPCYYCGDITVRGQGRPKSRTQGRNANHYKQEKVNGIDRIDSLKGYNSENVVPCCAMCNKMKMEFTLEDWLSRVAKIYHKRIGGVDASA
jgi:hypothetical protein